MSGRRWHIHLSMVGVPGEFLKIKTPLQVIYRILKALQDNQDDANFEHFHQKHMQVLSQIFPTGCREANRQKCRKPKSDRGDEKKGSREWEDSGKKIFIQHQYTAEQLHMRRVYLIIFLKRNLKEHGSKIQEEVKGWISTKD